MKKKGDISSGGAYEIVSNPDANPPAQVGNLLAVPGQTEIRLTWQNPDDPDLAHVVIRRSLNVPAMDIDAGVEPTGTVISNSSYLDQNLQVNKTYFYTVFSVDTDNNYRMGEVVSAKTTNDTDGDGLSDDYENNTVYQPGSLKTDPENVDTDGDGWTDGQEVEWGMNPTNGDITAPVISAFTPAATLTCEPDVNVNITASDNVGITGWLMTQTDSVPLSNNTHWQVQKPTSLHMDAGYGQYTFWLWAKDAAGNVSDGVSAVINYAQDNEPPVISQFVRTSPTPTANREVTFDLAGSDNVGISGWIVTLDSAQPTPGASGWSVAKPASYTLPDQAGSYNIYIWAKDTIGNISEAYSAIEVAYSVHPSQQVSFKVTAAGFQTTYPEHLFDYKVEFKQEMIFEYCKEAQLYDARSVAVDPADGSFWVADSAGGQIIKFSANGTELKRIDVKVSTDNSNFFPYQLAVDPRNSSVWVGGMMGRGLQKFSADGTKLLAKDWYSLQDICLDPRDGNLWVALHNHNIEKLDENGSVTLFLPSIIDGSSDAYMSINPQNGELWMSCGSSIKRLSENGVLLAEKGGYSGGRIPVSFSSAGNYAWIGVNQSKVIRLSATMTEEIVISGFDNPFCLAAAPDGGVWVVNAKNAQSQIRKYSAFGMLEESYDGIYSSHSISIHHDTGAPWVADTVNKRIVNIARKLPKRKITVHNNNLYDARSVAVDPADGSFWVADSAGGQIIKFSANGTELKRIDVKESTYNENFLPYHLAIDPRNSSVWVGSQMGKGLQKFSADGTKLLEKNHYPTDHICLDPRDGSLWVAANYLGTEKLDENGSVTLSLPIKYIGGMSINPQNGELWLSSSNTIKRLSENGILLAEKGGYSSSEIPVSFSSTSNCAWIGVHHSNQLIRLSATMTEEIVISGFEHLSCLAAAPDGGVWVVIFNNQAQLRKYSGSGMLEESYDGIYSSHISIHPGTGAPWVADNKRIVEFSQNLLQQVFTEQTTTLENYPSYQNNFDGFKNSIAGMLFTDTIGKFHVNGTIAGWTPAWVSKTRQNHDYVNIAMDDNATDNIFDDQVIAHMDEIIPETKNPAAPWSASFPVDNITVNPIAPVELDLPPAVLINGEEKDPNGDSSNFSVSAINNPKATVVIKTRPDGSRYLEVTVTP